MATERKYKCPRCGEEHVMECIVATGDFRICPDCKKNLPS